MDLLTNSLNNVLADLQVWCDRNSMVPHPEKCIAMIMQHKSTFTGPIRTLRLGNNIIKRTTSGRLLGVQVNNKLSWSDHAANVARSFASWNLAFYDNVVDTNLVITRKILFTWARANRRFDFWCQLSCSEVPSTQTQDNFVSDIFFRIIVTLAWFWSCKTWLFARFVKYVIEIQSCSESCTWRFASKFSLACARSIHQF